MKVSSCLKKDTSNLYVITYSLLIIIAYYWQCYKIYIFLLGSIYNISIISFSNDFGEGGSTWLLGETDISYPDPPPPTPNILDVKGKTATIEIPSLVNNNGPINAIQVEYFLIYITLWTNKW